MNIVILNYLYNTTVRGLAINCL